MRLIPTTAAWRKSILLYRYVRYRRGYGVHSPFVFNLITKVIEEKSLYYSFYDIELIRKQLLFKDQPVAYPDRRQKDVWQQRPLGELVRREGIRPKHGALLFRLTNYFKPRSILQLGAATGLSTLYLTSYAKGLKCIALENVPEFAAIIRQVCEMAASNPVDLRIGAYAEVLPAALQDLGQPDFVFFNTLHEQQNNAALFEMCLKHVHENTVFVFEGIQANRQMSAFWQNVCACPQVTVTLDLYSLGIVFFNKKLHKRDYIVYF